MSSTISTRRVVVLAASLLAAGLLAAAFAGVAAAGAPHAKGSGKGPGGVFAGLTQQQRSCIASQGVTRPSGRPTLQDRKAIFAAAKACGVTLPDPTTRNPAKQGGRHHHTGQKPARAGRKSATR